MDGCYVGHAMAARDLEGAASGGVASALMRYLLERGVVTGVMTARMSIKDGRLSPEAIFANEPEHLADCRNSFNFDFQFGSVGPFTFRNLVDRLADTDERIAVVGLYCQLNSLLSMLERRGISSDRVIKIGLFCSHAPHPRLIHDVLRRVGADMERAERFRLKTGGVGNDGRLHATSTVTYPDGTELVFKLTEYTILKNLWFDAQRKCLVCPDQFAENADISLGDAWYPEIRSEPLKHSTVISRSPLGDAIVRDAAALGYLDLRVLDPASIVATQRRVTGIFKVGGPARTKLAPLFGISLPRIEGRTRPIDYIHAAIVLANVRMSQVEWVRQVIMRLPTWAFLPGIAVTKAVESRLLGNPEKGNGVGEPLTEKQLQGGRKPSPDDNHTGVHLD